MNYTIEKEVSSYFPLRRIEEDEDMLTNEYERIVKTIMSQSGKAEVKPALDVITTRLDQLQEAKQFIKSIGLNEIY